MGGMVGVISVREKVISMRVSQIKMFISVDQKMGVGIVNIGIIIDLVENRRMINVW